MNFRKLNSIRCIEVIQFECMAYNALAMLDRFCISYHFSFLFYWFFTNILKIRHQCKGLPTVVFQPVNILLPRLVKWYFVNFSHSGHYNFIVNPIKRWLSHCAVLFNKTPLAFFDVSAMSGQNFPFNFWDNKVRTGIEYPFLDRISCNQMNRSCLIVSGKPTSQISNEFAGINNIWGKFHRIGVDVFNNYNELRAVREPQNLAINFIWFTLQTVAYKP